MLKAIKEELFPVISEELNKMSRGNLLQIKKYVFQFACAKGIKENSRNAFYELIEQIDQNLSQMPANDQEEKSLKKVDKNEEIEKKKKKEIYLENQLLFAEILASENFEMTSRNKKIVDGIEEESDSKEGDENFVNKIVPRVFKMQQSEDQDANKSKQSSENRNGKYQSNEAYEEFFDQEESAQDEKDALDFAQFQDQLPPYFMLSKKKKKSFFRNLTQTYLKKIHVRKSNKKIKKVNFNINSNEVRSFFKDQKIR